MANYLRCAVFLAILMVNVPRGSADRTNKKIYIKVGGSSMCFRRMNATHQIGCNSARGGNVGVVHYIEKAEDMEYVITTGTHAPYVALLTSTLFTEPNVKKLVDSGKVNGILVAHGNGTDKPDNFSPDETCPNEQLSLYRGDNEYGNCKKRVWNPLGNGFLFQDFNLPIVALTNDTEITIIIKQCFEKFNKPLEDGSPREFPLCSVQVKDEMDAAKDTPTCLRRSTLVQGLTTENYCDALGSHNVFASTRPVTFLNPTPDNSIIIASARMDGTSFFEGLYPAAESTVAGIVTLLAAAKAIGDVRPDLPANHKPIMFAFFNGEAYDYIGSSRMIYDMEQGKFPTIQKEIGSDNKDAVSPLSLKQIHSIVEVGQVGLPKTPGKMWLQTDPLSPDTVKTDVNKLVEKVKSAGAEAGLDISIPATPQPLPPASLQSFLKRRNVSGVVITDHENSFNNEYYNSRFDTAANIMADYPPGMPANESYDYVTDAAAHLQKVATTLAKTLYTLSTDKDAKDITVDNTTVANLLYCYLHDPSCPLFQTVNIPGLKLGSEPLKYYVGVSSIYSLTISNLTEFTRRTLAFYMGETVTNVTKANCKTTKQDDFTHTYTWMVGNSPSPSGLCYKSTANLSLAKSPAFDIEGYDWSSNEYSSWSESQWQTDAMEVRIFLVPSKQREIGLLLGGLSFALFSVGTVYFVNRRARSLFTVTP